uniref:25kDa protein n=1 Tax=Lily latent virus TaxID=92693 RepID=Q9QBW9_LSV|nr:25kDa protein [Lily latent virus]
MDVLLSLLSDFGFERLSSELTLPIVIHSVPGGGKSSLIRALINKDKRFAAFTFGKEDCENITGVRIKKVPEVLQQIEFALFDEYLEGAVPTWAFAVFADPLQGGPGTVRRAHFIKRKSHRFGKCTAQLLTELGYAVEAEGNDVLQIQGLYDAEPQGTVLFYEPEVGELLRQHSVPAYCISEIRGQSFTSVTFVTGESYPVDRALAFQCLTRHCSSLLILCPNATYTTA